MWIVVRICFQSFWRATRDNRSIRHLEYHSPCFLNQWRDVAHSLRELRRVNNAFISTNPAVTTFRYSSHQPALGVKNRRSKPQIVLRITKNDPEMGNISADPKQ